MGRRWLCRTHDAYADRLGTLEHSSGSSDERCPLRLAMRRQRQSTRLRRSLGAIGSTRPSQGRIETQLMGKPPLTKWSVWRLSDVAARNANRLYGKNVLTTEGDGDDADPACHAGGREWREQRAHSLHRIT